MDKVEVMVAQNNWAKFIIDRDIEKLLDLYDFENPKAPALFKPTLANIMRLDRESAQSYFEGNNPKFPDDTGFLNKGWTRIDFHSAIGPISQHEGLGYLDMGQYTFVDGTGQQTLADYTFSYHKRGGTVRIALHHSSLVWRP